MSSKPTRSLSLTTALDALYAAGPDRRAAERAQARLRRALDHARSETVYYTVLPRTPIGQVYVAVSERGLVAIDFNMSEHAFLAALRRYTAAPAVRAPERVSAPARQVQEYLAGERAAFDLPVDLSSMTAFQRRVLAAACRVPRGQVTTYAQLARRIGRPKAARAVGQALGSNPVPIVIPCHRIIGSDGSLHGYSGGGGIKTKAVLLQLEGARLPAA